MPVTRDYSVIVTNPTEYDGDPFEVAERATAQAEAIARIYLETLESARLMARNAELERQLIRDGSCDAVAWEDTAEGKRYRKLIDQTQAHIKVLSLLERAAGFNPKATMR